VELTYLDFIVRLIASAFLGGLVGFERERADKPAGLRTHIVVCLASTLIMLLSIHVASLNPNTYFDPGRIAAQVISGMGFLGAGTIIRQGNIVRGLTTAASLWFVAGLGLAVGAGYFLPSLISVVIVLFVFFFNLDRHLGIKTHHFIEVTHSGGGETTSNLINKLLIAGVPITELTMDRLLDGRTSLTIKLPKGTPLKRLQEIAAVLSAMESVSEVSLGD